MIVSVQRKGRNPFPVFIQQDQCSQQGIAVNQLVLPSFIRLRYRIDGKACDIPVPEYFGDPFYIGFL